MTTFHTTKAVQIFWLPKQMLRIFQTGSRISASLNSCTHWDMFRALHANPCPMRVAFQKPEM